MLNRYIIKKFIDSRKVNSFQEFIEKHDNNGQTISSAQKDEIVSDYLLNENVISKFYQDKDTERQAEIFELFNKKTIQNRELFWILFGFVFNNLHFSIRKDEQIRNIFEYRNRLDGLLVDF